MNRAVNRHPRMGRRWGEWGRHARFMLLALTDPHPRIAERLGVDQSTITKWELNRTAPALLHLLPRILVLINFEPTPATRGLKRFLPPPTAAKGA